MDEQVYISRYGTSQLDEGWELLSQEARHRDFEYYFRRVVEVLLSSQGI